MAFITSVAQILLIGVVRRIGTQRRGLAEEEMMIDRKELIFLCFLRCLELKLYRPKPKLGDVYLS